MKDIDKKRKRFHALKNKVFGKDDALYRDFLSTNFGGKASFKNLTAQEIGEAITMLAKMSGEKVYTASGKRGSQRFLTPGQEERIDILKGLLGWTGAGVLGFVSKQTKQNKAVRWLMNYEASKVVLGMQKVLANGDTDEFKYINKLTNKQLRKYQSCQKKN